MDDATLSAKLWEVLARLGEMNILIELNRPPE